MSRSDSSGTDQPSSPVLLTLPQVANILQVSVRTVARMIDAGDLVSHRFGRQLRISRADFETFVKARRGS